MKKIFTFIAVALVALTANAKKTLDISGFNSWGEGCTWNAETQTLDYSEAWKGAGLWLGGDYSDYDVIVLKLKSCTTAFKFVAEYLNAAGDAVDPDKGNSETSGISGATIAAITLNESYSDVLAQVWIQSTGVGQVVIDEIYAGTFEEFEADKAEANKGPKKSDLTLADLGSGWGESTYDPATKTVTIGSDWSGKGWWLGDVDYSDYDNVVIRFDPATAAQGKVVIEYNDGTNNGDEGLFAEGATEVKLALSASKNSVKQIYSQGPAGSAYVLSAAYVATANYQDGASTGRKSDLTLSDLGSGWGESTYDPATKTVTIGSDWSGKGWWLGDVDYSDYDNVVIKFDPATAAQGKVVIEYNDGTNNGDEGLFAEGATEVKLALSASKNSVKQIYIQGPAGSAYVLSAAYVATSDYSEGTASISSAVAVKANAGAIYNLRGQKVDANYKGLVIKDGKKLYQK